MLKVAAHQTADMQVLGLARHLGADTADTAHDQLNPYTRAARLIQRHDNIPIAQGVHLCNDMSFTPSFRVFLFPLDQIQETIF